MAKRLKRKEIKRTDEFVSSIEKATDFLQSNWKPIVGAVGAVLVIFLIVLLFGYLSKRGEDKAELLLNDALKAFHGEIVKEGETPTEIDEDTLTFKTEDEKYTESIAKLEKVIEEHGSSSAGILAKVYKGICLINLKKIDEAETILTEVTSSDGGEIASSMAQYNLVRIMEIKNNWEEAATEYERLVNIRSRFIPHDVMLMNRGAALEKLERYREALESYRQVVDEFPDSPFRYDAERNITRLEEDYGLEEEAEPPEEETEAEPPEAPASESTEPAETDTEEEGTP
ncbi:tol-pal system YbgF family protein [Acidobacteriota bacterium]